ncbi:MAG: hypothetical protein JSW40_09450 [Candidatus Omnitrophota bacterium]|nr:MAG: hypothetical protein JSW40_09450 [Candidatus Omnitrophota bacterium]
MRKRCHIAFIFLTFTFLLNFSVYSGEELTLTTYYPAPYGVYKELYVQRMAIGDGPATNPSGYCWPPDICANQINQNANLVVEGNVGIGTTNPQASLDVTSTTSGFLPPRMNTDQRNRIDSVAEGMIIYNATTHRAEIYSQGSWHPLGEGKEIAIDTGILKNMDTIPLPYYDSPDDTDRAAEDECVWFITPLQEEESSYPSSFPKDYESDRVWYFTHDGTFRLPEGIDASDFSLHPELVEELKRKKGRVIFARGINYEPGGSGHHWFEQWVTYCILCKR